MKKKQIKKAMNHDFVSLDKSDFNKIIRASNSLIHVINRQERKKKKQEKTENQIQEFMSANDMKMRKRFEDIIEKIDKIAIKQNDKSIIGELTTIKKLIKNIMIDMMYIPI